MRDDRAHDAPSIWIVLPVTLVGLALAWGLALWIVAHSWKIVWWLSALAMVAYVYVFAMLAADAVHRAGASRVEAVPVAYLVALLAYEAAVFRSAERRAWLRWTGVLALVFTATSLVLLVEAWGSQQRGEILVDLALLFMFTGLYALHSSVEVRWWFRRRLRWKGPFIDGDSEAWVPRPPNEKTGS